MITNILTMRLLKIRQLHQQQTNLPLAKSKTIVMLIH